MQLFKGNFDHIKDDSQPCTTFRYCIVLKNVGQENLEEWQHMTQSHRALATHVVDWLDENVCNHSGQPRWYCPPFDASQISFRGACIFFKTSTHAKAFVREFTQQEPNVRIPFIEDSTYSTLVSAVV